MGEPSLLQPPCHRCGREVWWWSMYQILGGHEHYCSKECAPVCDPECRDPQAVCMCDPLQFDGDVGD